MLTKPTHRLVWKALSALLVVTLLTFSLGGPLLPRSRALDPLTIGGLIGLANFTLDKLNSIAQQAIDNAGEQVRRSIDTLKGQLGDLIAELEQTYQNNLDFTIDQLDQATSVKLLEVQARMEEINQVLEDDINLIAQQTRDILNQASTQIAQLTADLEQRLSNLIVITADAITYVIDRTLFNVVMIIALVLFGIGLLLFIWLLFSGRLPQGSLRPIALIMMIVFIVVFGAVGLVPRVRAQVMSTAGLGLEKQLERVAPQPELVGIIPRTITLGETTTVRLLGVNLRPEDTAPTVTVGGQTAAVTASSEREIAINVSALTLANGTYDIVLSYGGTPAPRGRALVEITRRPTPPPPADLTITTFTISPTSPVQGRSVEARVNIRNNGAGDAGRFTVLWQPRAADPGIPVVVQGLSAGASRLVTFPVHAYTVSGTFDSIATIDSLNQIAESNENNNSITLRNIVVQPPPPRRARVTVTFTSVTVHNDADPFADGEMWLDFNVGGQTGRFPNSGIVSVGEGSVLSINRSFTLTLQEGQRLTLLVNGTEEDLGAWPDENDPMGRVEREFFSSTNWGAGQYNIRSTCPDGCYTIAFTISTVDLP